MKKIVAVLFLALGAAVFAKSKAESEAEAKISIITRVKTGGAVLFRSEADSEKVQDLSAGEEVAFVKQGKARSMIKVNGTIGWVENVSIEKVKVAGAGTHNLKDVEVVGWLDNPSAVYILDNSNPDLNALPIDRSFNSEIVEKKDREEVERTYEENR